MPPIYTCIVNVETPEDAMHYREKEHARCWACKRAGKGIVQEPDRYTALPWTMESLPGTVWRNLYTASPHTVTEIGLDRVGRFGPDPDRVLSFSIGCYRSDRFEIDHWVRVDCLPPAVQVAWAVRRVHYCKGQLEALRKQATTMSKTIFRSRTEMEHQDLDIALAELQSLTESLDVTIPPTSLALPGEQMALF
jgi:hypothetical protein